MLWHWRCSDEIHRFSCFGICMLKCWDMCMLRCWEVCILKSWRHSQVQMLWQSHIKMLRCSFTSSDAETFIGWHIETFADLDVEIFACWYVEIFIGLVETFTCWDPEISTAWDVNLHIHMFDFRHQILQPGPRYRYWLLLSNIGYALLPYSSPHSNRVDTAYIHGYGFLQFSIWGCSNLYIGRQEMLGGGLQPRSDPQPTQDGIWEINTPLASPISGSISTISKRVLTD